MASKKHVTLVFEYETDEEFQTIRELAGARQCNAWSMDHELLRNELMKQAAEDGDTDKVTEYFEVDGILSRLGDLRTA